MAKNDKAGKPGDPFDGLAPEQIAGLKAYFDSMMADERKAMNAMLEEAANPVPASVAEAAGLDPVQPSVDNLMSSIQAMYDSSSAFIAQIERHGRDAAQSADHQSHTDFSRLATVFGEFRNGLATILPAKSQG